MMQLLIRTVISKLINYQIERYLQPEYYLHSTVAAAATATAAATPTTTTTATTTTATTGTALFNWYSFQGSRVIAD